MTPFYMLGPRPRELAMYIRTNGCHKWLHGWDEIQGRKLDGKVWT